MSLSEIQDLYRTALVWTDGDADHAKQLVNSYLRGSVDRAIIESATR